MRGTRWLLLVALAAILGGVALKYRASKAAQKDGAIPKPDALSTDLNASAQHWQYRDKDHKTGRIMADIDAESMQQVKDSSRVDLTNVTMKLYNRQSDKYDLVKSASAAFSLPATQRAERTPGRRHCGAQKPPLPAAPLFWLPSHATPLWNGRIASALG